MYYATLSNVYTFICIFMNFRFYQINFPVEIAFLCVFSHNIKIYNIKVYMELSEKNKSPKTNRIKKFKKILTPFLTLYNNLTLIILELLTTLTHSPRSRSSFNSCRVDHTCASVHLTFMAVFNLEKPLKVNYETPHWTSNAR